MIRASPDFTVSGRQLQL